MGGGGFMQHASDTNRKDKAQKVARREKFNGNYSDKTMMDDSHITKLDFSHLTDEEINAERKRIKEVFRKRKIRGIVLSIVVAFIMVAILFRLFVFLING